MISDVVGSIVILFGALFFLFPESLRRSLRRKATWKLRRYFLVAAVSLAILLVSAGWQYEGLLPKVLMVAGIIAAVKGLVFLHARAGEKVATWILERPAWHLRVFAVGQIALGSAIVFGLA